ncbi:hypothetical protein [Sporosarcina obsidiansis]|uniref:hypothetical protein n=1 Tax=Sporosarcina obsidiansis TaxID=2660748 RepID=UPI00129B456B|nr:hypothetical protein [Sporosarcina obsidiansis]
MFVVLGMLVIIGQVLLYQKRFGDRTGIWIQNILLSLLIGFLSFTSFPDNYTIKKAIALVLLAIGVVGFIVGMIAKRSSIAAKLMLSVSVIGGLLYLFF